jgi:hypothetical protein
MCALASKRTAVARCCCRATLRDAWFTEASMSTHSSTVRVFVKGDAPTLPFSISKCRIITQVLVSYAEWATLLVL